jgi:hypothetical protein
MGRKNVTARFYWPCIPAKYSYPGEGIKNFVSVTAICIMTLFFIVLGSPLPGFAGDSHYQSAVDSSHDYGRDGKETVRKKSKRHFV